MFDVAGVLLLGVCDARSLAEERAEAEIMLVDADGVVLDRKLEEEDRVGGLVTSLALTLITNMIRDQILSILGDTANGDM